ncbi:MAG TPA: NAD-binding protein [Nevskiaceae bacterium]|nr:NAD-binding protein [Nevskiaceae bacterium]
MPNRLVERSRTLLHYSQQVLRTRHWFPHLPLSLLLMAGGLWMWHTDFGGSWRHYFHGILGGNLDMPPTLLPPLLIGGGLITMAVGLLWRSRSAWIMAILLTATAAAASALVPHNSGVLSGYFLAILVLMLLGWRSFDRSSLTGSTLFAVTSVLMVIGYATFGNFYLGSQFDPPIKDLVTALYFAIETMSTVGYGDYGPKTPEAKLFIVSVIVLGLTVFATSLTAVIAPLMSQSLKRLANHGKRKMKRDKHFVVIGNTSLAINTWRELAKRGRPVTRILRTAPDEATAAEVDVVVGDPGDSDVLRQAGADRASAVLAMLDDDSENAFVVLAVKSLGGPARTVAAVNNAGHDSRLRLVQPDITIAPQVLGGELMAMVLSGETVNPDFVLQRLLQGTGAGVSAAAEPAAPNAK